MWTVALGQLVTDLQAAGLSASADARDVNPPGVLVRVAALVPATGKLSGHYGLRASLLLVAPDAGDPQAYADLEELHTRVLGAGITLTNDEQPFERLMLPDGPTGLPCLRLTTLTLFAPAPAVRLERENAHG